jgi:hypothetical protein
MAYTLSNLLQDALKYQGIDAFDVRVATDGSTTTFIDTTIEDAYGDDELKNGTIFVVRTTVGLPPQGEFARISAYTQSSFTVTFDVLTAAVVGPTSPYPGDTCMLVSPEYPIRTMIELANDAVRDCGEITGLDATTITIDGAKEYTLPVGCKRLVRVCLQNELADADNNEWSEITDYEIDPSPGNVAPTIIFQDSYTAGYTLKFVYNGFHPILTAYDSPINEAITPPFAALVLADKIMQWHGVTNENSNYANKILSELAEAKATYPVRREKARSQFLIW